MWKLQYQNEMIVKSIESNKQRREQFYTTEWQGKGNKQ